MININPQGFLDAAARLTGLVQPIQDSLGSCVEAVQGAEAPGAEFNDVVRNWTFEIEAIASHASELGQKAADFANAIAAADDQTAGEIGSGHDG